MERMPALEAQEPRHRTLSWRIRPARGEDGPEAETGETSDAGRARGLPTRRLETYPALAKVSSRAFDRLIDTVCVSMAGRSPGSDPMLPSILAWSAVHGLASLWLDGPLTARIPAGAGVESIAEWVATAIADALAPER